MRDLERGLEASLEGFEPVVLDDCGDGLAVDGSVERREGDGDRELAVAFALRVGRGRGRIEDGGRESVRVVARFERVVGLEFALDGFGKVGCHYRFGRA